jgi:hypothetical protein
VSECVGYVGDPYAGPFLTIRFIFYLGTSGPTLIRNGIIWEDPVEEVCLDLWSAVCNIEILTLAQNV